MKKMSWFVFFLILALSASQMAMSRRGQYDEEARAAEKAEKEAKKQNKDAVEKVDAPSEKFYQVEEPEKGTDETTKIKIKLPGT